MAGEGWRQIEGEGKGGGEGEWEEGVRRQSIPPRQAKPWHAETLHHQQRNEQAYGTCMQALTVQWAMISSRFIAFINHRYRADR